MQIGGPRFKSWTVSDFFTECCLCSGMRNISISSPRYVVSRDFGKSKTSQFHGSPSPNPLQNKKKTKKQKTKQNKNKQTNKQRGGDKNNTGLFCIVVCSFDLYLVVVN